VVCRRSEGIKKTEILKCDDYTKKMRFTASLVAMVVVGVDESSLFEMRQLILQIQGHYSVFDIDLASPTLYDRVAVSGNAQFDGGVLVNFLLRTPNGFDYRPAAGDSFTWLMVDGAVCGLPDIAW